MKKSKALNLNTFSYIFICIVMSLTMSDIGLTILDILDDITWNELKSIDLLWNLKHIWNYNWFSIIMLPVLLMSWYLLRVSRKEMLKEKRLSNLIDKINEKGKT